MIWAGHFHPLPWWALHAEEGQDPAEEALNAGAFAQLLGGPGGRQPVSLLLPFGVPGNHRVSAQDGVDPGNQLETPVARIQAHDPQAQGEQADGQPQQRLGKGGVVDIGAGEQEEQR